MLEEPKRGGKETREPTETPKNPALGEGPLDTAPKPIDIAPSLYCARARTHTHTHTRSNDYVIIHARFSNYYFKTMTHEYSKR